ncbi:hypothetical protein ACN20G_06210 [Streptomyces sp. BI20]|uniref:hypothetical protein n=1 Tax=Streptomyces sp. BI20 TaxID=3403460 RepID=UPI003C732926
MEQTGSGISIPDTTKNPVDTIKNAEKACESRRSIPQATEAQLSEARALTACMRRNGVSAFPEPDPRTAEHLGLERLNLKESPEARRAGAACRQGGQGGAAPSPSA